MTRIIETEADIAEGAAHLARACRHMARVLERTGPPPLRRRPSGFEGLARIVTGQQLSIASAEAIWGRLRARVVPFEPEAFLKKRGTALRACGLSAGKVATLRGVAKACADGGLDFAALARADADGLRESLTRLKGIGPWSADIYALFCLGHADAWAPGDLALRHAVKDACALEDLPGEAAMENQAERWRPWRGVAARALWAYYRISRETKSGAPV